MALVFEDDNNISNHTYNNKKYHCHYFYCYIATTGSEQELLFVAT